MNRTLTPKEKFTFVFLALIVIVALWYLLFFTPTTASIEQLGKDKVNFEEQTDTLNAQIVTYKKWQEELGIDMNNESDDFPKIADYNNIRSLTAELNTILADANSFSLSFAPISTPEEQGKDCYRRDVSLNFETGNYVTARAILQKLNESQYGCLLQNVSIVEAQSSGGESAFTVSATLSFFEYAKLDPALLDTDASEQPAA